MDDELNWLYDEASIIDEYKKNQINMAELKKQWEAVADKFVTSVWLKRYINEKQKEMLEKYYKNLVDDNVTYSDYKKSFNFMAKFFGLPSKTIIIEDLQFHYDEKDKEQFVAALRYSKGQAKVQIPEGVSLIHIAPVDGITELKPSFRSKKKGMFMYPSYRVFFTIAKDIKSNKAGLSSANRLYRYRTTKDIKEAYIDPTYNKFQDGSVYIETETPIPVERYDKWLEKFFNNIQKSLGLIKDEKKVEPQNESVINILDEFLGKIKTWKTSNEAHSHQVFRSTTVSDEEYEKLTNLYKIMREEEDYIAYKKAFDAFCRYCHIVSRGTILVKIYLSKGKEENKNNIYVEYSYNTKKMDIPADLELYHNTKVEGLKELKPFFRGKKFNRNGETRQYFYDKPRIYLTVNKNLPKFLADYKATDTLHKYVCKQKIKQAYVDPLVWIGFQGSLYIETNKPIPVEEITETSEAEKLKLQKSEEQDNNEENSKENVKNEALIDFGMEYNLVPELIEETFSMDNEILFVNEGFVDTVVTNPTKAKKDLMAASKDGYISNNTAVNWAKVIKTTEENPKFKATLNTHRSKMAKLEPKSKENIFKRLFATQGASLARLANSFTASLSALQLQNDINNQMQIQNQITQQQLMIQQQNMDMINQQNIHNQIVQQQMFQQASLPVAMGGVIPNTAFGMPF